VRRARLKTHGSPRLNTATHGLPPLPHTSIFSFHCELKNQRGQVIFTAEKSMIFPIVLPASNVTFPVAVPPRLLEEHLVSRADR